MKQMRKCRTLEGGQGEDYVLPETVGYWTALSARVMDWDIISIYIYAPGRFFLLTGGRVVFCASSSAYAFV